MIWICSCGGFFWKGVNIGKDKKTEHELWNFKCLTSFYTLIIWCFPIWYEILTLKMDLAKINLSLADKYMRKLTLDAFNKNKISGRCPRNLRFELPRCGAQREITGMVAKPHDAGDTEFRSKPEKLALENLCFSGVALFGTSRHHALIKRSFFISPVSLVEAHALVNCADYWAGISVMFIKFNLWTGTGIVGRSSSSWRKIGL